MNVQIDYALIGQRIRDYRRRAHLTQAELAERAGVCQQYIGCLEHGKGIPSLATIMSLCHALSIEPNVLLMGCATDDPDAACSLRCMSTVYSNTLSSLLMADAHQPAKKSALLDPAAFPLMDLTLEDTDLPLHDMR